MATPGGMAAPITLFRRFRAFGELRGVVIECGRRFGRPLTIRNILKNILKSDKKSGDGPVALFVVE